MRGRLSLIWGALLCLAATPAAASQLRVFEVRRLDGLYTLRTGVFLAAPPADVWRVLTDYRRLPELSDAILESQVLKPGRDAGVRVRTLNRPCVLWLCKTIRLVQRLRVTSPARELTAETEPAASDLAYGAASWRLTPEAGGTYLVYRFVLRPAFWVPPLIGPWMIQRALTQEAIETAESLERLAVQETP